MEEGRREVHSPDSVVQLSWCGGSWLEGQFQAVLPAAIELEQVVASVVWTSGSGTR